MDSKPVPPGTAGSVVSNTQPPSCLKILIVDDSASQRATLSAQLMKAGYAVTAAPDAETALSLFTRENFSLVISDWMMPGMSGLDLCREIRNRDRRDYVYFILLTSKTDKQDVSKGLTAGADDFLSKPIDKAELFARILAGTRIVELQNDLLASNRKISSAHDELQHIYKGIEGDLKAAACLQQAILPPSNGTLPGLSYATCYHPCTHIGGDLVGIFAASGKKTVAYSIDVAGHGISAALLTVRLAQTLSPHASPANPILRNKASGELQVRRCSEFVGRLNAQYQNDTDVDQYFTMAVAVIDVETGTAELCQAGHPNPAVLRANGRLEFVGNGGPPVGLLPTADFESFSIQLHAGDRLILYSDGITEAEMDTAGCVDDDGLAMIMESFASLPVDGFSQHLLQHLELLCGTATFADDISAICIEFLQNSWR